MLKINRKLSVTISIAITALMFLGTVALAFFLPSFLEYLLGLPDRNGELLALTSTQRTVVYAAAYTELFLMASGLGMLFALLILIRVKRFADLNDHVADPGQRFPRILKLPQIVPRQCVVKII